MQNVQIIAEAGVNHNGKRELAFELVDAAIKAGADVVKFQTFKAGELSVTSAPLARYQIQNLNVQEDQLSMLSRLELPFSIFQELKFYCDTKGITFLSTAFDDSSLKFLLTDLGLTTLKIPSGEITNAPFLLEHARSSANLILSTGMSTLSEIESALAIIAYGMLSNTDEVPTKEAIKEVYSSREARIILNNRLTLLHCTSEYPAAPKDINLRAMRTLSDAFGVPTGLSDHSEGTAIAVSAVALGANIVEKHFTLNKNLPGPDHKASLEPVELTQLVKSIRQVEIAMGSAVKVPTHGEIKTSMIVRKSIKASQKIHQGQRFTMENLCVKRPGVGVSPFEIWDYIGKTAQKDYLPGECIE